MSPLRDACTVRVRRTVSHAVIDEPQDDGAWSVRIYHNPLVPWIWLGAILIVLGGAVSLSDRRLRVGAPRRARRAPPAGAKPQAV